MATFIPGGRLAVEVDACRIEVLEADGRLTRRVQVVHSLPKELDMSRRSQGITKQRQIRKVDSSRYLIFRNCRVKAPWTATSA